jgi:Galactose oxidase, central domain
MMPAKKIFALACLTLTGLILAACSGIPGGNNGGGGGGTPGKTTFTIGGTVTGLAGTGLVLVDNGTDMVTITGTGTVGFTFKTAVASGAAYAVTVGTQPSSPAQTCTVTGGTGTATANVTSVAVTCTTATVTIGGTVTGLSGTGLVLLDNGGDALTVTGTGTVQFTFNTALNLGGLYNVTVQTQPTNPTQTCSITNGSGAATANVTNVSISCSSKYSIAGTVNGLSGSGLVLQNNGLDNLPITGTGTQQFTFPTLVPGTYSVTVLTQPSNPTQTCLVTSGTGTATANVTNVTINCSSGFPIGGTVSGLNGAGLVLQDNGGDNLTVVGTGSVKFTFASLVTGAYAVTVKTQPSNPAQNCSVLSNGTGTAAAPVTNVQVSCGAVYTVGGTVSGLLGTGLTLEDTLGTVLDQLPVTGTGAVPFTFAIPAPINSTYTVSVITQPTNPAQNCFVNNGTGKVTGTVNTVQVVCQQPAWTISGTQVGLVALKYDGTPLPGGFTELINNGGDNIFVTGNNVGFHFPTGVTNNGKYNVNVFLQPTSQTQPCTAFSYLGVATANVDNVIIDCQHNDWAWMFGPDTSGTYGDYGTAVLPPPPAPAADPNTPGGRDFAVTWSGSSDQKWIFGGWGLPIQGASPPYIPYFMGDLWVFLPGAGSGGETGIWAPADLPTTTTVTPLGVTTVIANLHPLLTPGSYSNSPSSSSSYTDKGSGDVITNFFPAVPGARWGSVSWTDPSGNFYLFGGQGHAAYPHSGLLNDLWKFVPSQYDGSGPNYGGSNTYLGAWTNLSGYATANVSGVYTGTAFPGSRWGAAYCMDSSGTLWMFGGQGYDSAGAIGLLNDLWKYSGGQWTWVGPSISSAGQNNGVYGTLGTPTTGAFPGGRQTAVLWADNNGNLWLFGGLGLDSVGTQNPGNAGTLPDGSTPEGALLNDLWQYNIATQEWTWMSGGGATGLAQQIGVYGTQQVPAVGFYPGSRWGSSGWSDSNGNIWFFGGWGYASSLAQSTGFLDDIWEYHTTGTNKGLWTWWKGSSNVNESGNYPTYLPVQYGVPFVNNQPGARRGAALWQQDSQQDVWMFGGQGYDSIGANGYMGETWTYLPFPY